MACRIYQLLLSILVDDLLIIGPKYIWYINKGVHYVRIGENIIVVDTLNHSRILISLFLALNLLQYSKVFFVHGLIAEYALRFFFFFAPLSDNIWI